MRKALNIALSVLVWGALVSYLVWAYTVSEQGERGRIFRRVEVTVKDSAALGVITPSMVRAWIDAEGITLKNMPIRDINTLKIEQLVERRGFVRDAKVYADMSGVIHISLSQRHPFMRVNTYNGYNFYITGDEWILPLQNHAVSHVPIVTGTFMPPFGRDYIGALNMIPEADKKKFAENYHFLHKLINFVRYIEDNSFWEALFVQINVVGEGTSSSDGSWKEPDIELIPRVGDHIVLLGTIDDYEEKLGKLMLFYRKAIPVQGWDAEKTVNLRYKGQIVCTK